MKTRRLPIRSWHFSTKQFELWRYAIRLCCRWTTFFYFSFQPKPFCLSGCVTALTLPSPTQPKRGSNCFGFPKEITLITSAVFPGTQSLAVIFFFHSTSGTSSSVFCCLRLVSYKHTFHAWLIAVLSSPVLDEWSQLRGGDSRDLAPHFHHVARILKIRGFAPSQAADAGLCDSQLIRKVIPPPPVLLGLLHNSKTTTDNSFGKGGWTDLSISFQSNRTLITLVGKWSSKICLVLP